MNIKHKLYLLGFILYFPCVALALPSGFVYLKKIDPTIIQEMRYAGNHNFIGRPVQGYQSAECILTKPAAEALKEVQTELRKKSLSLKVYDCYRPQQAVNDFIHWSTEIQKQEMKAEFYPRVDKKDFFKLNYVAKKSGHTRGSTVDLTIVPLSQPEQPTYSSHQKLTPCYDRHRFKDNSLNMGSGFDCMDEMSHIDTQAISNEAQYNRLFLSKIMHEYGFKSFKTEWWHFSLQNEPYPNTYFNFPVS